MPLFECAYKIIHTTISYSPFEIVYGFNPLTPLTLMFLLVNDRRSLNQHFQILEKINENAYKMDLSGMYHVSAILNVTNTFPFDPCGDSRSNPFEERGNDGNQGGPSLKDMLQVPDESITSSRA